MVPTAGSDARPRLGIICLDLDYYVDDFGLFEPEDLFGLGHLPIGFFESPSTWPIPTAYAVARGAGADATVAGDSSAGAGLAAAAERLADVSTVILPDCGFLWQYRAQLRDLPSLPPVVFAMDLLDLAGGAAPGPIGVLTWSETAAERLLADHPLNDRLRIVGLNQNENWKVFGEKGWTFEGMRSELLETVDREVTVGRFADTGTIVLECTALPQFHQDIQSTSRRPVFDAATIALGLLTQQGLRAPRQEFHGDLRSKK